MKRILITLTVLALAAGAFAEERVRMTLRDCLIYAREHASDNRINRLETQRGKADRGIALASLLPVMELNMSGNMSFGRNIDPETNTYDNRRTLSSGMGVAIAVPLFDGLVRINSLRSARMEVNRLERAARAREDRISIEVIRSYYNVSYCKAIVTQMEEALQRDLGQLRATECGASAGTKSEADVADVKALVAADEYELTDSRNRLAKAYLELRDNMGMSPAEPAVEVVEAETGDEAREPLTGVEFEHPDVAEARWAERAGLYGLRGAKGEYSPVISLNAGISTSYYKITGVGGSTAPFRRQWHDNMGEYVGMTLSFPIFTGLGRVNRVRRARIALEESRERLSQARLRTAREKEEAALDYRSAVEEWRSASGRLEAERKAFDATSRKFALGGASAIDLYTASAKLSVARATLEGKRIQVIVSRMIVEYYNGIPLIRE